MNKELSKRILTSLILLFVLGLTFFYTYVLIIALIFISLISWIEFNGLLLRIFKKDQFKFKFLTILFKFLCLIYLIFFSVWIFEGITNFDKRIFTIFLFLVCICSDIGGLVFGKIFKGKKLTKISPNKTIAGSLGSFILSLILVPIFYYMFEFSYNLFFLIILTALVSLTCQIGDLFISYLKRKAKVKDTGDLLPGHGGILDRIDGILFAVPLGFFTQHILQI